MDKNENAFDMQGMMEEMEFSQIKLELALDIAPKIETIEEAEEIYSNTDDDSEEERYVLQKWIELCGTCKELCEVYNAVDDDSEEERLALRKYKELASNEVQEISTLEQAKTLYRFVPKGSEAEKIVLRKIASFFGYVEK